MAGGVVSSQLSVSSFGEEEDEEEEQEVKECKSEKV